MTTIFVVAALFTLLAFKKPAWAMAALLFLLPVYQIRFSVFGWPTTLLEILIAAFLAGLVANFPDYKKLKHLGRINWAIGLLVLAAGIATLISPEPMKALGQLKAFFIEPVLLFYAAVILFADRDNLKNSLRALFISSSLISLFGLIQYWTYLGLPIRFWGTGVEPERITSVFEYPNALALFLAPLFGLFLTLIYKKYQLFKQEWLEILGLLMMAGAIILTFSRGAWLALVIVCSVFFFKHYKARIVLTGLIVLALAALIITPVRLRILSGTTDSSSGAHLELMQIGTNQVLHEPFLGNGLYGFRTTLQQANFKGERLNYPHNIFLNFWLELGMLGILALGLIVFAVSEQQKKQASVEALAASVFLLVVILHGLVDVPYFKNDLSILFWFAISLFYLKPQATDPT